VILIPGNSRFEMILRARLSKQLCSQKEKEDDDDDDDD